MRKTLLKLSVTSMFATSLLSLNAYPALAQEDSDTIATVGDNTISKEDFYQAMKNVAGPITLRTLILEITLENNVEDAEALKQAAEDEVNQQITEAGGEEVFQQLLASQQLGTLEDYQYQIYVRNLFQEVVEKNIDKSDDAINDYYENQYEPMMEAQHILVETEEEALDVIERINNGEEFDAVAIEVSNDGSAQNGGLLQPFTSGQMVPEFEEAVKSQENGTFTQEPVESQYGFHVIKTINNGEKLPLDEVRDTVEEQYISSKFADTQFAYGVIGQLIVDTGYEIFDEDLQSAVEDLVQLATAQTLESTEEAESSDETEANVSEETKIENEEDTGEEAESVEETTEE